MTPKLAVLVSGTGSLLEAMKKDGLPIDLVLADRHCRGFDEIAAGAGITRELVLRPKGMGELSRVEYTQRVCDVLLAHEIGLVAMAGFMTIFSRRMFFHYGERVLNAHPSLLPSFKGEHAVRDALAYGVKMTGCTVHVATEKLDAGPIIAQEAVPVLEGDTEAVLHERIKTVERILYPKTIRAYGSSPTFRTTP